MNIKVILTQFGLDEKEIRVYLATLELGKSNATTISKAAKIQRPYFYHLCLRLIQFGLIKEVNEGKKKLYIATNPEQLLSIQKERLQNLQEIMPELKALHNTSGQKPKVFYYNGWEGINQINKDTLTYRGELVAFTTPKFFLSHNKKMAKEHIKKRLEIKQKIRLIGQDSPALAELKEKDWKELRETRLLPQELFSSNVEIGVYGNKTFIVDYKGQLGVVIEGTEIAKTIKQIFNLVWNQPRTN